VWPRRQEVPEQWVQAGPAPMEGVERINMIMVHLSQRAGLAQCNPYAMYINRGNRDCYNCRGFEHLTRNCRNRGNIIGEERRLEYDSNNEQRRMIEGENK